MSCQAQNTCLNGYHLYPKMSLPQRDPGGRRILGPYGDRTPERATAILTAQRIAEPRRTQHRAGQL